MNKSSWPAIGLILVGMQCLMRVLYSGHLSCIGLFYGWYIFFFILGAGYLAWGEFKSLWGLLLIGGTFNFLVMAFNGGRMPVVGHLIYSSDKLWVAASSSTKLVGLADRHDLLFGFSIGDVICLIALLSLPFNWIKNYSRRTNETAY